VNLKGDAAAARPSLIVINGCPRSGTSLLESLLAKKFNAAVMPETHFIPHFRPYLFLWGGLKMESQRKELINAIYDFTEIRTNGTGLGVEQMRPYCMLSTRPALDQIAKSCSSYPEILFELFDTYRKRHKGDFVIEKTAYYRPFSWEDISCVLPDARFIHVVRDGRDVVTSWSNTWFGPKDLALSAWLWGRHVREGLNWEIANPHRCFRLRYEDLLLNPEENLTEIGSFIGTAAGDQEYDQSSTRWYEFITSYAHMKNLSRSVKKGNINKWHTSMNPKDVALFETIAGAELEETGYQLATAAADRIDTKDAYRILSEARLKSVGSKVEWQRRMVAYLPPAIWMFRLAGISLPSVLRKLNLVKGR
jgi:hypothetical protein